jgi:hypothetical protein
MGPDDPWSPGWRPDESGERLRTIQAMRRGSVLAGLAYLPVAVAVALVSPLPQPLGIAALVVGLPGVALLGAGLTPAAAGSRLEAAFAAVAFGIGIPVAAVTSLLIGAFLVGVFAEGEVDLTAPILRAGVSAAATVAPAIALAAALWVAIVRRVAPVVPISPGR